LQAPEANVALLADLEHAVLDSDPTVCRLAILSLLAVFRQILPTYNIRSDYSKETETQVSRAVADLRRFELSLHNAFTTYVNDVTYMLMHKRTNASVKQSCVRALGGILSSRPDTNQRIKIVSTLIAAVCVRDDLTALEACRQVAAILDADPDGQLSLHLVRSVNRVLKAHPYRVRPQLLEALRSVHLRESMTDVDPSVVRDGMRTGTNSRRAEGHLSHQESRNRKAMRKIEHDMREAHSKRTKDRRVRVYIDLLNAVFLIYFRVLKQLPHTALLPLALDGCAKFAHLINIEMMNDLLRVLEKLLKSAATNPAMRELPVRLKCILAGYRSLRNQGYVIDIDVKQFSSELYEQLLYMPNVMLPNPIDANDYVAELLYAVYVAVCEQPNNEVERAAAFAKRVATLALSLAPNQAIAAIVTIQHIIRKYPRVSTLLDTETAVSGVHLPWVEDPAHCNAMAASFWELAALSSHWHPTVRKYALATVQSKFARLDPDVSLQSLRELVHGLDVVSRGTFDPAVREPPAATQKRSRSAHAYLEKQDQFVMRNIDAQRLKARAPAELAHADAGKASALPNDAVARFRRRRANKRLEKRIAAMEVQLEAAKHYAANKSTKTKQKQRQQ
jgi:nucleolar complex protein 3